ncbi:glycosyltransferase, group 1 domain containing protein [Acanthamoeba castellanii str. Neff]|uniref:Glycosyltransferase, group 1 domain containing protein n=1 Tax=Acanthamoeba castellanii (strain ATCC 30010 / Neff) TaxID=1257118 RepID=L8GEL5_ACACF|nr:glycosyltransferase, group 1 domain containing protein [Acanthamoeba castellanii str. Neff]ELR11314.1 glycosyltransferase, group 1 domain containing protein [Acanthamoeba castellanii str. Neff]
MSEIWVPTDFHASSFAKSGVNPDKLVVIPESVDVDAFNPDTSLPLERLPGYPETQDHFKFLSIFKWEARKGWDILARAFYEEFTQQDNVTLYLLTNAFHPEKGLNFTDEVRKIGVQVCEAAGRHIDSLPGLIMIDTHVPQTDLPRLYKSVQAFVLPTRGEGWGRPIAEAMSMGLPTIATAWSGPTQFMNETNSYPLPIEGLTMIEQPPWKGHYWAEPNRAELRRLMREVVSNPEAARERGANARADALHRWSPSCGLTCDQQQVHNAREGLVREKERSGGWKESPDGSASCHTTLSTTKKTLHDPYLTSNQACRRPRFTPW